MICKKHPKYKAIRQPKVDCDACWCLYHIAEDFRKDNKLTKKDYQKLCPQLSGQ